MMTHKKIFEKIIEAVIYASGTATTIVVLLIVFFLFREGLGLFRQAPMQKTYTVAVHPQNPVRQLSIDQLKAIFSKKEKNWKTFGGKNQSIETFSSEDIEKHLKGQDLGEAFSKLKDLVTTYAQNKENLVVVMPKKFMPDKFVLIPTEHMSIEAFFRGKEWRPTSEPIHSFGVLPIIVGTLLVCFGALLFAIPTGIIAAIYLVEIANKQVKNIINPFIELLAGIPSVIYGFFGLVVIVPFIQKTFALDMGETALTGSIILGIISLPTIITISEDAIRSVPRELKEASFALGANHLQTIFKVIVPYALSGIVSAAILGVGRTIGETMAVLMVTGNAAQMPSSFLDSVRVITSTVAAELGETAQGGIHYRALFMLACVLFILTFWLNLLAEWIVAKKTQK
ncbi:phosphate ABC transporter permease subunit PstC [Microscilla marina]|uniref:Phosphate transport system permease protein n=1 Tax=Microscilla marina ATCC 23134 TaxID=313606 RepID=A1ZWX2_MICM2|nr:phosphate ABC transporter permease subunit PstC [Microscilla marina]EAY25149.1 phosphate ABC transporter, permease protein PstC [Microscilla marina ATCC 23134]